MNLVRKIILRRAVSEANGVIDAVKERKRLVDTVEVVKERSD